MKMAMSLMDKDGGTTTTWETEEGTHLIPDETKMDIFILDMVVIGHLIIQDPVDVVMVEADFVGDGTIVAEEPIRGKN